MGQSTKSLFLLLVLVQGAHSVEEYLGRLWESFPPATFLCSLISDDHETGFLVINVGLFVFGLWSWFFAIRNSYSYARGLLWFWIVIELINVIGHPLWAVYINKYTPGLATTPLLLVVLLFLLREQRALAGTQF